MKLIGEAFVVFFVFYFFVFVFNFVFVFGFLSLGSLRLGGNEHLLKSVMRAKF